MLAKTNPQIKKQQGLAILVLVIIIAMSFMTYYVSDISLDTVKYEKIKNTQIALKKAKQALLSYAVLNVDNDPGYFGFLPCPDVDDGPLIPEGGSHGSCKSKNINTMGLFPWASLETGVLSSYSGDCFWYALSGEYKSPSASKTEMLNEDTNGSFKIYDSDGVFKIRSKS